MMYDNLSKIKITPNVLLFVICYFFNNSLSYAYEVPSSAIENSNKITVNDSLKPIDSSQKDNNKNKYIPAAVYTYKHSEISSPLTGFIQKIVFKPGEKFNEGDVLVKFNCDVFQAEQQEALAKRDKYLQIYKSYKRLNVLESTNKLDLIDAKYNYHEAQAKLAIKDYIVSMCNMKAPFSGQVLSTHIRAHEYIEQGSKLIDIANAEKLYLKLIVPSLWLNKIKIGTEFKVSLMENDKVYQAKITHIINDIDPISHTIVIYGEFEKSQNMQKIIPGMTGKAIFSHE